MIELESHEIEWSPFSLSGLFLCVIEPEHLPVSFHLQAQPLLQILGNRFTRAVQLFLVRAEQNDVIHVPCAVLHAVERQDVSVERFKVEVRKPLADEKADGKPLFAGLKNIPCQLQVFLVLDLVCQHPDQLPAVDRVVEMVNIHFADVPASFFAVVNDTLAAPKRVLSAASRY